MPFKSQCGHVSSIWHYWLTYFWLLIFILSSNTNFRNWNQTKLSFFEGWSYLGGLKHRVMRTETITNTITPKAYKYWLCAWEPTLGQISLTDKCPYNMSRSQSPWQTSVHTICQGHNHPDRQMSKQYVKVTISLTFQVSTICKAHICLVENKINSELH